MVTEFYERNNSDVILIAKLKYPQVWLLANPEIKGLLDNTRFMVLRSKFNYANQAHHAQLPSLFSGSRLWAVSE